MSYTRRGGAPGNRGVFLFHSEEAHLLTTCEASGGMPAASCALRGGMRLLREPLDNAAILLNCHHCPRSRPKGVR